MSFRRSAKNTLARALNPALDAPAPAHTSPATAVIGLGNPGPEYAQTRHNAGFWCIDALAQRHQIPMERRRAVIIGTGTLNGLPIALIKPRAYVNRSGSAVKYLQARYSLPPQRLLLIYDDINLPPGQLRLRPKGSAGGHNGVKSVIEAAASQDFPRVRIGVGRPQNGAGQIEHVIGPLPPEERQTLEAAAIRAADAVECLLTEGIDAAMNKFN